ncbi:MAG: hypothetical protein ACYDDB_07520, partial [bacterium]
YATYNGQPLGSSNIAGEIVNIYQNLLGETVTASNPGVQYWAGQSVYDGGSLSIGQITADIYKAVESIPTTASSHGYTETMSNKILGYYNEAQALFIGLFDKPANESGLTYWETQLAANQAGALNAISNYATYNGQPLGSSNIAGEIVNIYQNLLGETVTASNPGVQYWAGLSIYGNSSGTVGAMSIGQITAAIYGAVENNSANASYQAMNHRINGHNYITMFNWTLGNITNSLANQDVYTLTASDTGHTFASGSLSDTLVIPLDYMNSSLGLAGNSAYFTFQGDTSGHNAVDINYDPVYTSNISYYLENATNFQILDFNYSQADYSNLYSSPLDLSTINSGFNTFILDDPYNTGTNGSYTDYAFTGATSNDTFVVQATSMELDIYGSANGNVNTANVIMDGGVGLGMLVFSPSSTGVPAPTVNIDSVGSTLNTIQAMGDMMVTGNNLTGSFTLNVYGSDALSIGTASYPSYTASNNVDNGIELQDGSTLTIAGHSSSSNLTAYIYENSPTITSGVTVNAAGFAGTLSLIETQFQNPSPDNFILGSGTDSVATNNVNASVTVGSGTDTIISNAAYSADSSAYAGQSSLNTTPGQITTIQGNILAGDSITFGTPLGIDPANWQIYPGLLASGTPSPGTGVTISSLTQYNESGAASATAAITAVIAALEAPWDANSPQPVSAAGLLDYAGWFTYGGNTYIVNSDQGQNQVIELVGAYNLSSATYSNTTTATITNITH